MVAMDAIAWPRRDRLGQFCRSLATNWRGVARGALVSEANTILFLGIGEFREAQAPQCGTGVLARQICENALEIGQSAGRRKRLPSNPHCSQTEEFATRPVLLVRF